MRQPTPLLHTVLNRRSVRPRRLASPAPTSADLQTIIAAGLRGPDHGQLRPWRLVHVTDREALAVAFVAAERELRPNGGAEMEDRARARAHNGPCLLVLVARIAAAHPETPPHEQWIAIGAALNQMLLAAEALGFAGGILSGRKTQTKALRSALGIGADEQIVGFITLGTRTEAVAPPRTADPAPFLERWPPSKP